MVTARRCEVLGSVGHVGGGETAVADGALLLADWAHDLVVQGPQPATTRAGAVPNYTQKLHSSDRRKEPAATLRRAAKKLKTFRKLAARLK